MRIFSFHPAPEAFNRIKIGRNRPAEMPDVTTLFVPRPKPLAILLYENGHCHKSTASYQYASVV